ncbi:MAG: hypothetical protein CM15mV34_0540 [Caudoviricetes sp.]|nr:MAG: hypothetical protein CM15mV34_0540 [Caudoviricetes sp.]
MKIIDKALDVELFSIIRKLGCDSQSLPWYLETDISGMGEEENCYFTHLFYNNDTVCSDYMKWGQALKIIWEQKHSSESKQIYIQEPTLLCIIQIMLTMILIIKLLYYT